jgi:hypothetical protein
MKDAVKVAKTSPAFKAANLLPILSFQIVKCNVPAEAELKAARAQVAAGNEEEVAPTRRRTSGPEPRQPMFCDTTPKAYGGSYTDCF